MTEEPLSTLSNRLHTIPTRFMCPILEDSYGTCLRPNSACVALFLCLRPNGQAHGCNVPAPGDCSGFWGAGVELVCGRGVLEDS